MARSSIVEFTIEIYFYKTAIQMYTVAVLIHSSSQQHFLFPYIYASVYCNFVSSYFSHFNLSKMKSQVTFVFFSFF